MAATFPLSLAQFQDALPIKSVSMEPMHNNEISRTRGGQFITAYNGPTLWVGTITLGACYNEDARAVRALLSLAQQYDASFLISDPSYPGGPRSDPGGVIHGARAAKLAASPTNMRDIGITALAPNYKLSSGDVISWPYASDPIRYAYHTIVFDKQATGTGTVTVEVTPMLKPGSLLANAIIELKRPVMRAKIVPGSVDIGDDRDVISEGSKFSFLQVLGE